LGGGGYIQVSDLRAIKALLLYNIKQILKFDNLQTENAKGLNLV
jgi:hypothetical protein